MNTSGSTAEPAAGGMLDLPVGRPTFDDDTTTDGGPTSDDGITADGGPTRDGARMTDGGLSRDEGGVAGPARCGSVRTGDGWLDGGGDTPGAVVVPAEPVSAAPAGAVRRGGERRGGVRGPVGPVVGPLDWASHAASVSATSRAVCGRASGCFSSMRKASSTIAGGTSGRRSRRFGGGDLRWAWMRCASLPSANGGLPVSR